jgi:hypothetical protein
MNLEGYCERELAILCARNTKDCISALASTMANLLILGFLEVSTAPTKSQVSDGSGSAFFMAWRRGDSFHQV